jgi:hypothetical protein
VSAPFISSCCVGLIVYSDPTGFGLHGDFINGWDVDILQAAIDKCTDNVSDVHKCSVFQDHDALQSTDDQNKCSKKPGVDEVTQGVIPKLPGCNTVQYGLEKAAPAVSC